MTVSFSKISFFLVFGLLAGLSLSLFQTASAADYSAQKMIATRPVATLNQLESYTYRIGFKNTGSTTWSSTGANRVTIKTTQSVRYEHWFASSKWLDKLTVTALASNKVRPGEIGFFNLSLEAPTKLGAFTNEFAVFAGSTKIPGTDFKLPFTVISEANIASSSASSPIADTSVLEASGTSVATKTPDNLKRNKFVSGKPMIRSAQSIALDAGEVTSFTIGFKNTGERNWRDDKPSLVTLELDANSIKGKTLGHGSWINDTTVASQKASLVKPGEISFFTFSLKAPLEGGQYYPEFYLVLNGDTLIEGTKFKVPLGVAKVAPTLTSASPTIVQNTPTVVCIATENQTPGDPNATGLCNPKNEEPLLRVGIDKLEGQLGVTANGAYSIIDNTGKVYVNVGAGITTFLAYDKTQGAYTAVSPGPVIRSPLPLRIKAITEPSIITLTTFINPVAYRPGWNDNTYRGAIEIRWSENDQKLWIINELPMEEYLKGLAESSNKAHPEYQKALIIAARSYALYHYQTKVKHRKRYFDVVATVSDQYYRGYESEKRIPSVAVAVEATRGQVVTYKGSVAITPYSASTSGTTRTWEEVWGGSPKPWLIKKSVPQDVGRRRFGHAVGMSQLAANDMAKEGMHYINILKFFYVGTEVSQWY